MATNEQFTALLKQIATQRELREARAAQSWYHYALGEVTVTHAVLIAPPALDPFTGQVGNCRYTVDRAAGRCSCPDQNRLDRLQQKAQEAGLPIAPVCCKHVLMLPQLLAQAEEAAKRQASASRLSKRAQWNQQRRAGKAVAA